MSAAAAKQRLSTAPELTHRYVDVGAVRLHVTEAGEGPLVVLLHGYPEFWYSWRHQIPALVQAGFRVVAPDMRGFNLSDKPQGVEAYAMDHLAADIDELIKACGEESAYVIGHDWGGAVAWALAMFYPHRVRRLGIINAPHPVAFERSLLSLKQLKKSWYMFFFQLPKLPEWASRRNNFEMLQKAFKYNSSRRDAFSQADIDRYIEAMAQPGASTATINYYRAIRYQLLKRHDLQRRVEMPVKIIWGCKDRFLGIETAYPGDELVPNVSITRVLNGSHWAPVDQPGEVNEALLEFLGDVV